MLVISAKIKVSLRPKAGGLKPEAESPAKGRNVQADGLTSPHAARGGVGRQRRHRRRGVGEPTLAPNDLAAHHAEQANYFC